MSLLDQIRHRRSVRTYNGEPLRQEEKERIMDYAQDLANPFGVDIQFRMLDAKEHILSSPVIVGEDTYLTGKLRRVPNGEVAFGYAFEEILLFADGMGLGTVWIGGTMNRKVFETAIDLLDDEVMPCVSPIGYPAEKLSIRENLMRKGVKADTRMEFGALFFDKTFRQPLSPAAYPRLNDALEMVRWAPSAVNKQPWRLLFDGNSVHFYEKHSHGYIDARGWDMQKIDIGIALLHFELGAKDAGYSTRILINDPELDTPSDMEYIVSCLLEG